MKDGGQAELSDHVFRSKSDQPSYLADSFVDELLKSSQVVSSEEEEHSNIKGKTTAGGNREAVRKYREKRKARTAYLEEEVKKLCAVNQELVRKLQAQATLEAELLRLRSILVDLRGKIDNELGSFPFQNHCNCDTVFEDGDSGLRSAATAFRRQCQTDLPPPLLQATAAEHSVSSSSKAHQ